MQPLRHTIRFNALTCAGFGLLFLFFAPVVSAFLGAFPELWLRIIGAGLTIHAGHLVWASMRREILRLEVYYFSAGDMLWFLASLWVLVATPLVTDPAGAQATLAVAFMVAAIGLAQLWTHAEATGAGLAPSVSGQRMDHPDYLPLELSRLKAIGVSWLGIKTWVKYWLFALNGIFLAAFFFWPSDLAKITLAAYIATLPLLLALIIVQRGMTRLLGIGHLIPWIPLLIYLLLRLMGDAAGSQITAGTDGWLFTYTIALTGFVALCLAFDVYDIIRWLGGVRRRLGSPAEQASRSQERSVS